MMNYFAPCLATLTVAMLSNAVAASELETCHSIKTDIERLSCYDRISGHAAAKEAPPAPSDWDTRVETSDMTDDTNVFLTVLSEEEVNCGWSTQNIRLILRCTENTTAAIFATGCHMTASRYDDYGDVTFRIDDTKAKTLSFEESTNNRSLGLWRGSKAIPFIKSMLGHERLLVRMTPYGENPFSVNFAISGLDDAIIPLREACNW